MGYKVPRCECCGEILDDDNVSLKDPKVCVMCEEPES